MGHELMGEVMEVGKENNTLQLGDRVAVPFVRHRKSSISRSRGPGPRPEHIDAVDPSKRTA
jgi:threonine dehydrogenase-like Zn-dependent dehydrogenase